MQFLRRLAPVFVRNVPQSQICVRNFTVTQLKLREVDDRKEMLRSLPKKDEGTAGERLLDIDTMITQ